MGVQIIYPFVLCVEAAAVEADTKPAASAEPVAADGVKAAETAGQPAEATASTFEYKPIGPTTQMPQEKANAARRPKPRSQR